MKERNVLRCVMNSTLVFESHIGKMVTLACSASFVFSFYADTRNGNLRGCNAIRQGILKICLSRILSGLYEGYLSDKNTNLAHLPGPRKKLNMLANSK